MPSAPREAKVPLTRWQYFVKNLYQNSANSGKFVYNKIIYNKSEELQAIDYKSQRINLVLVLLLVTHSGILIRTAVESIRVAGRATQGVIVMRFKAEGDSVISLALAEKDAEPEKTEEV